MNAAPLNQQASAIYTIARIAACLGRFPQAVRKSLAGVKPAGIAMVNGQQCAGYQLTDLPQSLRDELNVIARAQQYRDTAAMLAAPAAAPWQPPVALAECASAEIDRANKLRDALLPFLVREHDDTLSAAEFEAQGVQAYARSFGHVITTRHWRALFKRTLDRDAGAQNFGRLEIYLSDKPARKAGPPQIVCEALEESADEFPEITGYIKACIQSGRIDQAQATEIWKRTFDEYDRLLDGGETAKRAARRLRDFLVLKAAFLAPSRNALRMAFERKMQRRDDMGDRRKTNGAHFEMPQADLDEVEKRIVFIYGDFAPAWRSAYYDGKLTDGISKRWPAEKHRVGWYPPLFKKHLGERPRWLYLYHRHRRTFNSLKAHADSVYDGIHSLDCITADDVTLPVWFWYLPEGSNAPIVTRGQCLVFIDLVSKRIIGWSLQPDKNYNAIVIYSQMKRICVEKTKPKAWLFEHGIWERAKLISGRASITEVVHSFRDFGTDFFHADSPEGKFEIENVMGLIQNLMEGERGYCGRDERKDRPDWIKRQLAEIESGTHPSAYLRSFDEWCERLSAIFEQYNTLPQSGKHMRDRSPNQIYQENWNREAPPERCGAEVSHIFDPKFEKLVKTSGVSIQSGNRLFKYFGPEIAHLVGHKVLLWFDTENPEMAVVTTLDHQDPIAVPLHTGVHRLERLTNPESDTLADFCSRREGQVKSIVARYHVLKEDFNLPYRKRSVPDHVVELGQQMEIEKGVQAGKSAAQKRNLQHASRLAADGVVQPARAIGRNSPDTGKDLRRFLNEEKSNVTKSPAPAAKDYILKSAGPHTLERAHIDYLLERLTEFRKAGQKSFGQKFGTPVSKAMTARIEANQLKCDLYAPEHFERVRAHLEGKVDATILGKRNTAADIPNYHRFEKEQAI